MEGALGHFLATVPNILRLPVLRSVALAFAVWLVLLLPTEYIPVPAKSIIELRTNWGTWIWIIAVLLSALTIGSTCQCAVKWLRKRNSKNKIWPLCIQPLLSENWWHLSEQQDGKYSSQISLNFHVLNRRASPIKIVAVKLLSPRTRGGVRAHVSLPLEGSPYWSHQHPAMPGHGVSATVHIMAKGQLGFSGQSLRISLALWDDRGTRYAFSRLKIPSHDTASVKPSLAAKLLRIWREEPSPKLQRASQLDWDWSDRRPASETSAALIRILREEQRNYAAKGRQAGKLGSLNAGLQHEPNGGWTDTGNVPDLLWPKSAEKGIVSPTVDRIIRLHQGGSPNDKRDIEERLLGYLHRGSPFADVSYAVFLALHRLNRTLDALSTALQDLKGDSAHAYSNVLGCLAVIVSWEHSELPASLIDGISDCLQSEKQLEFRLAEKLNLARVLKEEHR